MTQRIASGLDVVVVGGGIGGLTVGLALQRDRHAVRVMERADGEAGRGAGIVLWPNAVRILDALGVGPAIREQGRRLEATEIRTPAGRVLAHMDLAPITDEAGAPPIAIDRGTLHRELLAALPGGSTRAGVTAARRAGPGAASPGVVLDDGSELTADLVVGADGLRSTVRRVIAPEAVIEDSGIVAWRATVDVDLRDAVAAESWGDGRLFGSVPIGAGRTYWFAAAPSAGAGEMPAGLDGWHPPVAELMAATAPEAVLRHPIETLAMPRRWSAGRCVLLGDAAHAMTPNLGQGAAQAIEDAWVLAASLRGGADVDAALAAYQRVRAKRTRALQSRSARVGRVAHATGIAGRLRDGVAARTPAAAARRSSLAFLRDAPVP